MSTYGVQGDVISEQPERVGRFGAWGAAGLRGERVGGVKDETGGEGRLEADPPGPCKSQSFSEEQQDVEMMTTVFVTDCYAANESRT